ncbi:MAG: universal stress protein, partial [Terracoccus sp.]
ALDPALDQATAAVTEPAIDTQADAETDIDALTAATLHFAQGPVGEVLVRLSAHASLLVVGTREPLRDGHRLVTGSATHYCVRRAPCPVVTVPEPPPETPAGDFDEARRRVPVMTTYAQP